MKRFKLIVFLIAWMLSITPALAFQDHSSSSYAQTSDGVGYAHPNLTLKVYDNASAASGNVITEFTIIGADLKGGETFDLLRVSNGLYVDMTTSGTGTWWVEFKKP